MTLAMLTIRDFIAAHLVWSLPIGALLFIALMPTAALAVFRFLTGTPQGQILTALVVAGCVGWSARGYVASAARQRDDVAALAAERARLVVLSAQISVAKVAERRARVRAESIEDAAAAYQDKETAYEAELAKRARLAPHGDCSLDRFDLRRLRTGPGVFRSVH